ncbi:MAG: hypothetical protein IT214_10575 [Chitinophagaceae bacterium]|jgi:hypothetical protein|nr:hypothetical protein [Chitinophagaceae bacterium]OQY96847.1 MAG: hypothetical protein B6D37_00865 [Sphingobacteriales bacterium UTBCD1]
MEKGIDPRLRKQFKKILLSYFFGTLWLMTNVMAGVYFKLAIRGAVPLYANILFYAFLIITLLLLLRFLYKTWKQ